MSSLSKIRGPNAAGRPAMEELVRASEALAALCRHSFGPRGEQTLLFCPPDAPVVTGEGQAVLAAWKRGLASAKQPTDPLASFLLSAASAVQCELGDGSTEFALLVSAAIRHALDYTQRDAWTRQAFDRAQLSRAFGDLKWELRQELQTPGPPLQGLQLTTTIEVHANALEPSRKFREATAKILRSALAGMLSERVVTFLVGLVLEWVFASTPKRSTKTSECLDASTDSAQLHHRVQDLLKCAPDAVIFMEAPSVFDSYVVPHNEFILKKAVASSQPPEIIERHSQAESTNFLCITCSLSLGNGVNHVELATDTHEQLFTAQDAARLFISRYARRLRRTHNVRLVVCTEAIEASVLAACTRQEIACVQFAEPEDVEALCVAAGVLPLASIFDDIRTDLHVGVCSHGVSRVRFQQQDCLRLRGLGASRGHERQRSQQVRAVPQLLVHAPTKGVYKQYYAAITKALRVLQSWWELSAHTTSPGGDGWPATALSCRGGGATELALAQWLQDQAESTPRTAVDSAARQTLAKALLEVVAVLQTNLSKSCSNEHGTNPTTNLHSQRQVLLDATSRLRFENNGNQPQEFQSYVLDSTHELETAAGPIQIPELVLADPERYGLVHPWRRIEVLLFVGLETLEQLFRTDAVLFTTRSTREPGKPTVS